MKKVKRILDGNLFCAVYIPKEHGITSLVLANNDAEGQLRIVTHVTLRVNRQKMRQAGVQERACLITQVPQGYEGAVWLKPMVCTIEYMPSERYDYRQAFLKASGMISCPMSDV